MAHVASGPESPDQQREQKHDRVIELHKQLQDAELDNALVEVTVTMHGIRSGGTRGARLGPTPMTTVSLEDCETKALLDTGSPVTTVSLQFLLQH